MPYDLIESGAEPDIKEFIRSVEQALMRAGHVLQRELSTAPPKVPGSKHLAGSLPGGFYSAKQRAFVMSGIRTGTIKIPYLRTGNLERSWSVSRLQQDKEGLFVEVYSDPSEAPYNELVQQDDTSAQRQAVPMHQDWPKPIDTAQKFSGEIEKVIKDTLKPWGFA